MRCGKRLRVVDDTGGFIEDLCSLLGCFNVVHLEKLLIEEDEWVEECHKFRLWGPSGCNGEGQVRNVTVMVEVVEMMKATSYFSGHFCFV